MKKLCPLAAIPPWDDIEIQPCREVDDSTIEVCEPEDAQFWSVYLRQVSGGVQCIADVAGRKEAVALSDLIKNAVLSYKDNGYLGK